MRSKTNFWKATKATFQGCKRPSRNPDYVSYNKHGQPSSEYWYTSEGVYRCSNHWSKLYFLYNSVEELDATFTCGKVASCFWRLKTSKPHTTCGFASWKSFKRMK